MGKLLKSLLVIIITLVLIVALAVGGVWAFCYFKYDVNVFSCVSALNKLSSVPEESEIAANQPQESADIILAFACFQHLPDEQQRIALLKNCYRVLRYN